MMMLRLLKAKVVPLNIAPTIESVTGGQLSLSGNTLTINSSVVFNSGSIKYFNIATIDPAIDGQIFVTTKVLNRSIG